MFESLQEASGVSEAVRFRPAAAPTPYAVAAILEQLRVRVLRWFARSGLIELDDVRDMLTGENIGFSLDAAVRVAAHDRAGLGLLLRYCARPPFALERLALPDAERVVYRLPKPQRDGTMALTLTPLELIDHLAALIPPPRRHRHRYHGVLAPNSTLRAAATAYGREVADATDSPAEVSSPPRVPASNARSPARYLWAMLLARLFESMPLTCPNCGADMRIIAFITEAAPIERILTCIGEPSRPPAIAPARGPPAWDDAPAPMPDWDLFGQPEPDVEFEHRVAWLPPSNAGGAAAALVFHPSAVPRRRIPALGNTGFLLHRAAAARRDGALTDRRSTASLKTRASLDAQRRWDFLCLVVF